MGLLSIFRKPKETAADKLDGALEDGDVTMDKVAVGASMNFIGRKDDNRSKRVHDLVQTGSNIEAKCGTIKAFHVSEVERMKGYGPNACQRCRDIRISGRAV